MGNEFVKNRKESRPFDGEKAIKLAVLLVGLFFLFCLMAWGIMNLPPVLTGFAMVLVMLYITGKVGIWVWHEWA